MYAVSLKSLKNDKNMNLTLHKFGTGHQNHFTCFIYLFFLNCRGKTSHA